MAEKSNKTGAQGRKVLVITYYWPPSGGSGVQRWLKFVKYLPQFGWTPYVYTPENPHKSTTDSSLLNDIPVGVIVIKRPIWEPYDLFIRISGLFGGGKVKSADFVTTGKRSMFKSLASWIRGNWMIPDPRFFWVKPSTRFLGKFIREHGIQTVITTGPPHSMHLIGLGLKKSVPGIRWISDFRDPWSEWDLLDALSLTTASRAKHKKLEHEVLVTSDCVITIAPYHVQLLEKIGGRKVELITNGFDEDDFKGIVRERTSRFTIRHVGVVDELRDPRPVMEAIAQLCQENGEFVSHVKIEFVGHVNSSFIQYVQSRPPLNAITTFIDHLPHNELLQLYGRTDLQLLVLAHTAIAPGNLPGKFFEYLASGNPILAIGPVKGDAAEVLRKTGAGTIFERTDAVAIKTRLKSLYKDWSTGKETSGAEISTYTRRYLAAKLASLLDSLYSEVPKS